MLQINYFDKRMNGHYVIGLFDTELKKAMTVFVDIGTYIAIEFDVDRLMDLALTLKIEFLLSAKKGAADYPEGFRQTLEGMKETAAQQDLIRDFGTDFYKISILKLSRSNPKEMREFMNTCLSNPPIKHFSNELHQMIKKNRALFQSLIQVYQLCPDMFKTILRDSADIMPDYAPFVPRLV